MKAVLRTLAGIVVGLVLMLILLVAVEGYSAIVHPFPEGFGQTQEEICAHVARYPGWVLATVVPMWGLATLASVLVAGKVGNVYSASIIGALIFVGLGLNVLMLPYLLGFKVFCLLTIPLAVLIGIRRFRRSDSNSAERLREEQERQ